MKNVPSMPSSTCDIGVEDSHDIIQTEAVFERADKSHEEP